MPRIARPATPEALQARATINAFLRQVGISANTLSRKVNIGQPTLSRFLQGRTKSVTETIQRVLDYVHSDPEGLCNKSEAPSVDRGATNDLHNALQEAWDGRPETATVLAHMIRVLGPLLSAHIRKDGPG